MKSNYQSIILPLILLCMGWCTPATPIQAQVVEASLDTVEIRVGEQVQLKVKCTAPKGQRVTFPTFQTGQELTPGVEVVKNGRTDTLTTTNGGRSVLFERRYTITSFDSALYSIPPFTLEVNGRKVSSKGSIGLKVSTIPVDTVHVDQMRAPHGPVGMPFEWQWTTLGLSLLAWLLAAGAIVMWIRLSNPKLITRRVVVHPPVPAHVTAVAGINRIKQGNADTKAYYMELTDTLRQYIQDRFGFSAKEMTTGEIVERLMQANDASALEELRSVLTMADLVKFAKLAPSRQDQDHNLMQALDYVQHTKVEPQKVEKPHVVYISLSDMKQSRVRRALFVGATLLTAASLLTAGWILADLVQTL